MGRATATSRDLQEKWANRREAELAQQRIVSRCALCGWSEAGAFRVMQARFAEHMAGHHPEVPLERIRERNRKAVRAASKLKPAGVRRGYHGRREFASAEELAEREELRRERLANG